MLAHRKKRRVAMVSLKWFAKTAFISFETGVKNKLQHSKWPYPHPIMSIVGEDFWLVSWGRDAAIVLLPPGKNAWPPREMPSMCKTNLATSDSVGNNVTGRRHALVSFSKSRWHEMPQCNARGAQFARPHHGAQRAQCFASLLLGLRKTKQMATAALAHVRPHTQTKTHTHTHADKNFEPTCVAHTRSTSRINTKSTVSIIFCHSFVSAALGRAVSKSWGLSNGPLGQQAPRHWQSAWVAKV